MKKVFLAGLLFLVAVAASSPYWLGQLARLGYIDQVHAFSGLSGFPARVDRYDSGYLSASAGSTVTLPDPDDPEGGTIDLVLEHEVHHGPLVFDGPENGRPVFAAAVIDTVPRLPEALDSGLREGFGGEPPVRLKTVVDFTGNAVTWFSGSRFASRAGHGASGVVWDGFEGVLHLSRDGRAWRLEMEAPALRLTDEEERIAINGIRLASSGVIADDGLYLGDGDLRAGTVLFLGSPADGVVGNFELRDVRIRSEQVPEGDRHLQYALSVKTGSGRADGGTFDAIEGEIRLRRLDRATIAALQERMEVYESSGGTLDEDWLAREVDAVIAKHGADFIAASPELSVPRLSLERNGQRSDASLRVALRGEALAGIDPDVAISRWETLGPFLLLGAVDGELDLDVPQRWLEEALRGRSPAGVESPDQVLDRFVEQGYVERADDRVRTAVRLSGGAITLNGKPFNPLTLGSLAGE